MQTQAIIIGLGQFGMAVARELSERNTEVLAIDRNEERVRVAAAFATNAVCFDATNEEELSRTAPERRDVCVCAIGDEAKDASIICTALLRQLGAKRVIARANDNVHARILSLVGAHQVVNPEAEFGHRFANQILHKEIKGQLPLSDGVTLFEVEAPDSFVGHDLRSLKLPTKYGVTVVAIRKTADDSIHMPHAEQTISAGDILVVVSKDDAVPDLLRRT